MPSGAHRGHRGGGGEGIARGRGGAPAGRRDPPGGRGGGLGGAPTRGRGRGTPPGGPTFAARPSGPAQVGMEIIPAAHIRTVGVRRPDVGSEGRRIQVFTNHFGITIPDGIIHHYSVDMGGGAEKKRSARFNNHLIRSLQQSAPNIFTPRAVYDNRKNLFSVRRLPFPGGYDKYTFDVALDNPLRQPTPREPKKYKVTLTHVAEINPEVTARFLQGQQSHDSAVSTAIMALNVVVRMGPVSQYPFNARSFFTSRGKDMGQGIVLWRGYFQSVRPAPNRMLINMDISTTAMHKEGPLIRLCLEKLDRSVDGVHALITGERDDTLNPYNLLQLTTKERGGTLDPSNLLELSRKVTGIRVQTFDKSNKPFGTPRAIKQLICQGAADSEFELREGGKKTVAQYFEETQGQPLKFPNVICAEVGNCKALIPLEKCYVPPGQLMRKQLSSDMTRGMVKFTTQKPHQRLALIRKGLNVLQHGQSEYVRSFGMTVDEATGPICINARVLSPPSLKYGTGSKLATITPDNGEWNMSGQKLYLPVTIEQWMIVIYERPQRYKMKIVNHFSHCFSQACDKAGIRFTNRQPEVFYNNRQLDIITYLKNCGYIVRERWGKLPTLVVAVMPEESADIYPAIKHFGDIQAGVATQCVKAKGTFDAKKEYWANLVLKVNAKLGGINTIPTPRSVTILADRANPTVVMGADVIHPAAGSDRPSFASVVGNVDSNTVKYVASMRVQTSRQEMIDDLEGMAKEILTSYLNNRKEVEKVADAAPKRIIFYRDGVSDGQFSQVRELELPQLKSACRALDISPKITVIVVGKRHRVRMFPEEGQSDSSGNCPAGTVVDTDIAHPVEFDFYLQSHAGKQGTSRPSHYNVLYDDNNFGADELQSLSFALCHICARSTRSVSVPAPVYYADIVCSRAKNHFEPTAFSRLHSTDSGEASNETRMTASDILAEYKRLFLPAHVNAAKNMYFT